MTLQLKELLGRPISELGSAKRATHCSSDLSVLGAVKVMKGEGIGSLVVADGLKVLGIFTERDYIERIVFTGKDASKLLIGECMTKNPICTQRHESIGAVLSKMREGNFRHKRE